MNREEWLHKIAEKLRQRYAILNFEVPAVRISCGFPSARALSKKSKRLGECWWPSAAKDGKSQVFVTPLIDSGLEAAGVVAHELLHAGLEEGAGHGPKFKRAMKQVGLAGKATSALPGPELSDWLAALIKEDIGDYPNAAIDPLARPVKKQTTRMRKMYCAANENHETEYIVRASQKMIEIGIPRCPCGKEFQIEETEDDDA